MSDRRPPPVSDPALDFWHPTGSGTVEHAAWQNHVEGDGARRDQRPTDHRPVTVTLTHT
jgi:hypothetical protein